MRVALGKSTLLSILAGLITPTEGEVWVNEVGLHLASESQRARWRADYLAWQGAHTPFFNSHSVRENLLISAQSLSRGTLATIDSALETSERIQTNHACSLFGLSHHIMSQFPNKLSMGERQRAEVLKVWLSHRHYLLFDEPTSHLDEELSQKVSEALLYSRPPPSNTSIVSSSLTATSTATLIIATHNRDLARQCDLTIHLQGQNAAHVIPGEQNQIKDQAESIDLSNAESSIQEIRQPISSWTLLRSFSAWSFAYRQITAHFILYLTLLLASLIALLIPSLLRESLHQARGTIDRRAAETPLIVGGVNSPLQLFFSGLYFTGPLLNPMLVRDVDQLLSMRLGEGSPIVIAPKSMGRPLLGVDSSYYRYREFHFNEGRAPHRLGEVCVSESLADIHHLQIGSMTQTELSDVFQLTAPYPIEMKVVGLFRTPDHADQRALFTTLATAWAALGFAHAHAPVSGIVDGGLPIDQELHKGRVHLHEDPDLLPISALLVHDLSDKHKSLLKAKLLSDSERFTVIEPRVISQKTLGALTQLHQVLSPLINVLSALVLGLILLMISQRHLSRAPIRATLLAIGLNRRQVMSLSLQEYSLFFILLMSAVFCTSLIAAQLLDIEWLWESFSDLYG